jgi:hypothetical protein
MNETDFIRQQLAAERAHLREILMAVQHGTAANGHAKPVSAYIDWASRRCLQQLAAQHTALQALGQDADPQPLSRLAAALARAGADATERQPAQRATRLLALLDAWTEPLDTLAGSALRINHWRQAAALNADSILEERQRYAAARNAAGLA